MVALNSNEIVLLGLVSLNLIPSAKLIHNYYRTRIVDYLLFSGFFIFGISTLVFDILSGIYHELIMYQLHLLSIHVAFYFLFIHALRVKWKSHPKVLLTLGTSWSLTLIILVLMFEEYMQSSPAMVLFWEMKSGFSSYYPYGGGVRLDNGVVIYSTGHQIIGFVYFFLIFLLLIYSYTTTSMVKPSDRLIRAKKLWLLAWSLGLIWSLLIMPGVEIDQVIPPLVLLIGLGFIIYVIISTPEAILISHVQVLRIYNMYETIKSRRDEEEDLTKVQLSSLYQYIDSLPQQTFDKNDNQ